MTFPNHFSENITYLQNEASVNSEVGNLSHFVFECSQAPCSVFSELACVSYCGVQFDTN